MAKNKKVDINALKVGDKVKIKSDLSCGRYGNDTVETPMLKYRGEVAIIKALDHQFGGYYLDVDDCDWHWTPEMLEQLDSINAALNPGGEADA